MNLPIQASGVRGDPCAWPKRGSQCTGITIQGTACECTVGNQGCNGTAENCGEAGCTCNPMNQCVCAG
jgi:hypothetical protein